ncbi:MAG: sugar phosphate nucleotidyltransferase, partial [Xenococcaceae cyanobacterium]
FGTRMFPITKAIKKEFLPIIDRDGRAKPIILAIVEEAVSAGIEEIGIVVQKCDRDLFTDFFKAPPKPELYRKLSPENQEYSHYLQSLGDRITILTQEQQEGFGHAVFCAKDWINNESFLLLLGDHVYRSHTEVNCAGQLLELQQKIGGNVLGLTIMSGNIIHKAGCITGVWEEPDSILDLTQIYEKPSLEYARTHLHVQGMNEDEFLGVFGMYILESKIFDYLEADIDRNNRDKGEFQLTTCLEKLRQDRGMTGYLIKGQYFDTGMPLFYRQTAIDFYERS